MRLIYHPDAEAEFTEALRFYEESVPGLGEQFVADFDAAISRILDAPERWPQVEGDLRRYVMPKFPYAIYYRMSGEALRILVVRHHRRHPDYWKGRS